VPIVGVHAKKNPEGGEGRRAGRYTPKTADTDTVTVCLPHRAEVMVHLSAYDGALSLKQLTETGEPHYEPLAVTRPQRNSNKHGFRWYGYYTLPESLGKKEVSVRHHQNADDDARDLNRTENLRPIPESSAAFARLHVLRPDAESINRGIEDSLFINRASAKGWRRQMVDLLSHARLVNARPLQSKAAGRSRGLRGLLRSVPEGLTTRVPNRRAARLGCGRRPRIPSTLGTRRRLVA